jgi:DNA-binding response OmpR family regulator
VQKIALIEDDSDLHELLRHTLETQGYSFVGLHTGEGAVEFLRRNRPDVVVLDIMLPGQDGIEICRRLRADPELRSIHVIFLTALTSETDRILGLEMGADDYIVKPFSVRELMARIKARLRSRSDEQPATLKAGPLELNRTQYMVRLEGKPVPLTATEFRLLDHLMSHPGQVFSRQRLLDAVWGNRRDILERTVDAYIVRLRNKIEDEPSRPRWIRSMRGVGYSFQPKDS